jgi:hypothetical protein
MSRYQTNKIANSSPPLNARKNKRKFGKHVLLWKAEIAESTVAEKAKGKYSPNQSLA